MSGPDLVLMLIIMASVGGIGFVCGRAWEACVEADRELAEWARQDRERLDTEGQR